MTDARRAILAAGMLAMLANADERDPTEEGVFDIGGGIFSREAEREGFFRNYQWGETEPKPKPRTKTSKQMKARKRSKDARKARRRHRK